MVCRSKLTVPMVLGAGSNQSPRKVPTGISARPERQRKE